MEEGEEWRKKKKKKWRQHIYKGGPPGKVHPPGEMCPLSWERAQEKNTFHPQQMNIVCKQGNYIHHRADTPIFSKIKNIT